MRIAYKIYRVSAGSLAIRGHLSVSVNPNRIARVGERQAVAEAAWKALAEMGERQKVLRDVDAVFQPALYEMFKAKISFTTIGLDWRE